MRKRGAQFHTLFVSYRPEHYFSHMTDHFPSNANMESRRAEKVPTVGRPAVIFSFFSIRDGWEGHIL